ncbi:ABC transporter ATP-binding protein [Celeribacter litoreus]|uniref:ABC transporter ATP-binding protein n=1 Tax=Celeribacter litoreus TaxID=2876714 RepID=UPI001CCBD3D5|nr:ATP-binding cassette domain-containing protein [Celeribacter litoreus]MCA0043720.1 ATP-binding cassette domain-containing protein [Celeribacter litoreus]
MYNISLSKIKKSYGDLTILHSVDMEIEEGEFIVILGSSGCGKSTLLNIVAGLDTCDTGRIMIGEKDVTDLEPSDRDLSMVFQSYALFPSMTVKRNLSFGMEIARVPKAEREAKVAHVAKLLQIDNLLDRKPSQLSGGQRQRVAIGRALVRSTGVCLFDEPLSNLDAKLRTETRVELKKLHSDLGFTMLYVTHDQVEAMTMADRVAVMNKGRVEQFAPPQDIYEKPANLFVASFVGSPVINQIEGTLGADGVFDTGETRIDLGGYDFDHGKPEAQDAVLAVRCEDIDIVSPEEGHITADLDFVELLGADALAWVVYHGKRLSVRMSVDAARALPKHVGLRFVLPKASVFSAKTEQRL